MIHPEIYNAILNCISETAIAQAFRRAAGITELPRADIQGDDEEEKRVRYWRRMMHQRTGALDR